MNGAPTAPKGGSTPTAPMTAVLFCFRQEDVVADAVRALFKQSVQPAEIILSDDASPDGSFEVLQKVAKEYDGPAKLSVRRTEGSAGWFAHINTCMKLAGQDHVLVFAGDDISKPDRVERFAAAIEAQPQARLIWSMMERMTPEGEATGRIMGASSFTPGRLRGGVGASQCWHKELIEVFGDLPQVQAAEDIILPFRAWLLGGLHHISDPLVLWRDRDYRQLSREQLDWTYEVRNSEFRVNAAKVIADDLEQYTNKHPEREDYLHEVRQRLQRETVSVNAEYEVVRTEGRWQRLLALLASLRPIGFKRSKRLWQDQVLGLPAYLESAFPRRTRRWLPLFNGLFAFALILILLPGPVALRIVVALLALPLALESTRMLMRMVARILWRPG